MTCPSNDLKDYFFGELDKEKQAAVELHLAACAACREELDSLGIARAALLSLPDEEPQRRIAFVSDKVFEPRWWQKLWRAPQLGFASACMLAAAIVFHAVHTPAVAVAPVPVAQVGQSQVNQAQVNQAKIDAEVAKRIDAAVQLAVTAAADRQAARLLEVVNARVKQSEREYRMDLLAVQDYLVRMQKENLLVRKASYDARSAEVIQ